MPGPAPLTGVLGLNDPTPEATPEEVWGGPASPVHGGGLDPQTGIIYEQFYTGSHGPYGLDSALLGFDVPAYTEGAGNVQQDPRGDVQPQTHAAPWPKGLSDVKSVQPDDVHRVTVESFKIHSMDQGMRRQFDSLPPKNDEWTSIDFVDPGTPTLQQPVPKQVGQVVFGRGSTDRVQSLQLQNEYGFDSAHYHHRYAVGSIPGNYMWMQPGGRPLRHDRLGAVPNIPTGNDSPFTGDDVGQSYGIQGAILQVLPDQYNEPPTPNLGQQLMASAPPANVEWY